ncbi:hypothetical protein CLIB1423_09S03972 [[Candida] railenensis]|uniref:Uncharacterized protein n=1 Tax=[Candida] railenensis TaxID=45579 RepID=A0A9P0VZ43_9ASCO|nr:hypothetical protein CLIB1423_09S03972 [[Candida] railenensis]
MVRNRTSPIWNLESKMSYGKILIISMLLISRAVSMSIGMANNCLEDINKRGLEDINVLQISTPFGDILTTETDDDALDYVEAMYLNGLSLDGVKIQANNTGYIIEDITVAADPSSDTTDLSGLYKRWSCSSAPLGTYFTQRQTVNKGYYLSNLTQASGCLYSSSVAIGGSVSWDTEVTQSIDKGFDGKTAHQNAKTSYGYTLKKKVSLHGKYECNVPEYEKGALFAQSTMYWADQKKQKCVRRYYGKHGCKCGDWSPKIHGVVPVSNVSPKIQCVIGSDSGCS